MAWKDCPAIADGHVRLLELRLECLGEERLYRELLGFADTKRF